MMASSSRTRRRVRGPIGTRLKPAREQDTRWLARAGTTLLRQAVVALFAFGLIAHVMIASPPYEPLVRRLVAYTASAHHTVDEVHNWLGNLRNTPYPTSWPQVQEVWRRLLPSKPPAEPAPDGEIPAWSLIWPVAGEITSRFGWRTHPIHNDLSYHTGVDIAAPEGTPVVAARPGKVEDAGADHEIWGNYVIVAHADEQATFYAHLAELRVKQGQELARGDAIGTVGRTGQASEAHLHFEIRQNGHPIDPEPLLRAIEQGS